MFVDSAVCRLHNYYRYASMNIMTTANHFLSEKCRVVVVAQVSKVVVFASQVIEATL